MHAKYLGRQEQLPRNLARNSIGQSFNRVRKRCNSNDLNSVFETVAGELRAKLGAVSAMRQVRSGRDTCAVATGPGRATSGRPTLQTSSNQRNSNRLARTPVTNVVNLSPKTNIFNEKAIRLTTFVTTRTKPHASDTAPLAWRAPEGPATVPVGGGGAWPGFETTRRAKLAARTARGRAAAHRHTQRPGPPAPGTPAAPQATTQRKRAAAHRAAARSRSQCNTQRSRWATTSATWTAFRAAPLRRLSPETTRTRPRLPSTAWS